MVLAYRLGKPRGFFRGFLLTLATVGLYAVYWNHRAHDEVYKQFELAREERDEGTIWYILGLIFPPFLLAYLWIFASNVAYVRERLALPRRTTAAGFVGLLGAGLGAFLAGWLALAVAITLEETALPTESTALSDTAALLLLVGFLLLLVLGMIAYWRMQRDLNELWDAYDRRLAEVNAAPRVGPLAPAPEAPAHPTYWADLAPAQRPPESPPP